jgi:hypothetical protein
MANVKSGQAKSYVDPLERQEEKSHDTVGFFDQLFGSQDRSSERPMSSFPQKTEHKLPVNNEFSIFNHKDYSENKLVPEKIRELQETIKHEIKALKQASSAVDEQILNIEKQVMSSSKGHEGVYHVHFLETLLSMLKLLRVKVSEAGTWLQAIQTKKAKRGSMAHTVHKQQNEEHRSARPAQ